MSAMGCLRGALTAALLICGAEASWAQFSVSRFTIDGGGGTSSGGTLAVRGTIGQPDAGHLSALSFTLKGGFWGGGGAIVDVESTTPGNGVDLTAAAPLAFRLYPASPNPVAQHTLLAFDLPTEGLVLAALYDVSGRLVRRLVDESLPAGRHRRAWDRRNQAGHVVPSGVYFLSLEAGTHLSHQKVIVYP